MYEHAWFHIPVRIDMTIILSACKVRVIHRLEIAPGNRYGLGVEALELICHVRIHERVVEDISVDGKLLRVRRDREVAVVVRIDEYAVRLDKR